MNSSLFFVVITLLIISFLPTSGHCQTDEINDTPASFSPTKADDLYGFLLNEWLPSLTTGAESREAVDRLSWYVASGERDYGDLPEFWELAAFYPTDLDAPGIVSIDTSTHVEREKLVHALELYDALISSGGDSTRLSEGKSSVIYAIGIATAMQEKDKQEGTGSDDSQSQSTTNNDTALIAKVMIDYYRRAESANPKNAFFPLFLGVAHTELLDFGSARAAFERAGKCEYFEMPRMFQYRYLSNNLESLSNGEGLFRSVKIRDKFLLTNTLLNCAIPDFVALKRAFRTLLDNSKGDTEARSVFTILHRAACALGRDRELNAVTAANASVLLSAVAGEALAISRNSGDKNLELAALAVRNDADSVKHVMKGFTFKSTIFDNTLEELYGDLSESKFNPPAGSELAEVYYLTKTLTTIENSGNEDLSAEPLSIIYEHPYLTERHLYKEHINGVFVRLQNLDYTNPSGWYANWLGIKMYLP